MGDFDPSARASYTTDQIQEYFDRISLPEKYRQSPVLTEPSLARTLEHGLPLLAALQRYQLCAIPFENLDLHYSSHHTISLEPEHLFHKMVERRSGRGGYCMENSCLFNIVLTSLGYAVYATGARVNEAMQPQAGRNTYKGPKYSGWNHMINIVTMDEKTFHVDVGFGSAGPTQPVELRTGNEFVNVPPEQSSRLMRTSIPDTVSKRNQELWVYGIRFKHDGEWTPAYCYSETEFLPSDFTVMNHHVSKSSTSWFTFHVVCVKMLMSEKKDGEESEIIGDITLSGTDCKRRIRGKSEALCSITSDEERVEALRKYFGIELTKADLAGIVGMMTAL